MTVPQHSTGLVTLAEKDGLGPFVVHSASFEQFAAEIDERLMKLVAQWRSLAAPGVSNRVSQSSLTADSGQE